MRHYLNSVTAQAARSLLVLAAQEAESGDAQPKQRPAGRFGNSRNERQVVNSDAGVKAPRVAVIPADEERLARCPVEALNGGRDVLLVGG